MEDVGAHVCPVCGKFIFDEEGSYDFCEVCNWCDDPLQEKYPDFPGGANDMSLNQARKAYKEGRHID